MSRTIGHGTGQSVVDSQNKETWGQRPLTIWQGRRSTGAWKRMSRRIERARLKREQVAP